MEVLERVVADRVRARHGLGTLTALPPGQPELLHAKVISRTTTGLHFQGDYFGRRDELHWLVPGQPIRVRSGSVDHDAIIVDVELTHQWTGQWCAAWQAKAAG